MRRRRLGGIRSCVGVLIIFGLGVGVPHAQESGPIAKWSFQQDRGTTVPDSVHGAQGEIGGSYKYVQGISGSALRFDGYTTSVTISRKEAPSVGTNGFTVSAWVALNTYPWNWVPVIDQERQDQEGFSFGVDAFGHVGLRASVNGEWKSITSRDRLPLKKWAHITGSYETADHGSGMLKIYIDGQLKGQLPVEGELTPANTDILIGRVRRATLPFPEAAIHPYYPIWYSLDGIVGDVEIFDRALSAGEIASSYASVHVPQGNVLPWQKMPSGPPGAGPFGAYYATLHFQDTWDNLRRLGPDSDVVVRFDESPIRLVFWQGTNYVPAWVTENDKWYTDEFLETWGKGCPLGEDCEPMSDKQERYSRVNIIESNDARVVVHWRYALSEVEEYKIAWPDPVTGWGDWTDEYWTVYPDGIAVRKQVLHSGVLNLPHEWQETIVLNQPGTRPEDNINWDAVTLGNMQGETKNYHWAPKPAGSFTKPNGPAGVTGPPDPNIQIINLKSEWKPFQIVPPQGARADIYNGENTYFSFECWNHWPVAQIVSSGRPCVANDRASHTSLSHLVWKDYSKDKHTETKVLLNGLTNGSIAGLIPLAKSWLSPPKMEVEGQEFQSEGYDPTQRAYVVTSKSNSEAAPLRLTFQASEVSPLYDPAIVVKNWGDGQAQLKINGQSVAWGRGYRVGHVRRLQGTDIVIWIQKQSTDPLHVDIIKSQRSGR